MNVNSQDLVSGSPALSFPMFLVFARGGLFQAFCLLQKNIPLVSFHKQGSAGLL